MCNIATAIRLLLVVTLCVCACGDNASSGPDQGPTDGPSADAPAGSWHVVGDNYLWNLNTRLETAVLHQGTPYVGAFVGQLGLHLGKLSTSGVETLTFGGDPKNFNEGRLYSFGGELWFFAAYTSTGLVPFKLVGNNFEPEPAITSEVVFRVTAFEHAGALHLATLDGTTREIQIRKLDGSTWTDVGPAFGTDRLAIQAASYQGKITVASLNASGQELQVHQYDGGSWNMLPAPTTAGALGIGFISMAVTDPGELYLMTSVPDHVIYYYDGSSWSERLSGPDFYHLTAVGHDLVFVQRKQAIWHLSGTTERKIPFQGQITVSPVEVFPKEFILPTSERLWFIYGTHASTTVRAWATYFESP